MNREPKYGMINCVFLEGVRRKSLLALLVDSYFGENSAILAETDSTIRNVAVHKNGQLIVRSNAVAEDLIVPSGFCLEVSCHGQEWHGKTPTKDSFISSGDIGDIMATKMMKANREKSKRAKKAQSDLSAMQRESSKHDLLVEMLAALEAANMFITNGLEYGYIDLAEEDTSGMHTIDAIRQAIRKTKGWMES